MRQIHTIFIVLLCTIGSAHAGKVVQSYMTWKGSSSIAMGVVSPNGAPKADVLFLHGYGDTWKNHLGLFDLMAAHGLRTVAFDLPSHGATVMAPGQDLNDLGFSDLALLAENVHDHAFGADQSRPLFVVGWSTGGLLAVRMAQESGYVSHRPIGGLALFAPGVAVYPCVGNLICHITNETLTHNTSLYGRAISPKTPLIRPVFATKLLANATASWKSGVGVPSLVIAAGDYQDKYVITPKLKMWVGMQQKFHGQTAMRAYQCADARHELDNESASYGGPQVRNLTVNFLLSQLGESAPLSSAGPCRPF